MLIFMPLRGYLNSPSGATQTVSQALKGCTENAKERIRISEPESASPLTDPALATCVSQRRSVRLLITTVRLTTYLIACLLKLQVQGTDRFSSSARPPIKLKLRPLAAHSHRSAGPGAVVGRDPVRPCEKAPELLSVGSNRVHAAAVGND
jgi:hypothetical protein